MRSILLCCLFVNICFLCFPYQSFCEDPQFEECKKARVCGNHTIRFPFYTDENLAYCGYPGFELTCLNNDVLLLNISENQYRITDIFYTNNTLRVNNVFISRSGFCSLAKIHNLSLPSDGRFQLNSISNLTLLSNCTPKSALIYSKYKVGCESTTNDTDWVLAMKTGNPELIYATEACGNVTVVPLRDYSDDITDDYLKLMRNGFDLNWVATNCSDCVASKGYCGYIGEPVNEFQCFCSDRPHSRSCKPREHQNLAMKIGIGGVLGVTILMLSVLIIYCCRKKTRHGSLLFSENVSSHHKDVDAFMKQYGSSIPKRFRYSAIKRITNSFKDELGKGGYGNVYRGSLPDGRDVAVKVLNATKGNGEDFINEVSSIGRTSHVNIVTLLGFCYDGKRRALIYEFMPNGSLEKFIFGTNPLFEGRHLGWEKLLNIAIGIAKGLEYLHQGCNTHILHFDIKPHNILLDKDFRPKISDFGLAKLYTTNGSVVSSLLLQPRGTIGYIAPEVTSRNFGQVSHKSDVYSYGMMILEMVGGRKNVNAGADHTSEIYYPRWLYKRIQSDDVLNLANEISAEENDIVRKMVIIGLWCIQVYPSQRPSMSKVIEMLEGHTEALEIPPSPYLCSVPSSPSNSQEKLVFCSSSETELTSST